MSRPRPSLYLFGASTRAAAFSALRAELRPWCADLFADADLQTCCPVVRVGGDCYPHAFLGIPGRPGNEPWMYTGALENRPSLVNTMAQRRLLWGNAGVALARCRSPVWVSSLLERAGLPHPAVSLRPEEVPAGQRWLVKPLAGAGGVGIHFHGRQPPRKRRKEVYYQEHIDGEPCAALYVGDEDGARLLGVTRQFVGADWLHAGPFRYGGSVGPLPLEPTLRQALGRLGNVLTEGCHLRGLFGVDFVLRDGVPWPVEVNPRYTASVEVLEYALGLSALDRHRRVFEKRGRGPFPQPPDEKGPRPLFVGKAILTACAPLTFPQDGPWQAVLCSPPPLWQPPQFADIPHPGEPVRAGQPVLTFFASAGTLGACVDRLRQIALDLDRRLFLR
jgi:predicted ATP-grasp superfamily ATP-dependent carboligase